MATRFPYTNFHALNLDWIMKAIKNMFGGTGGQYLRKKSNANLDYEWHTITPSDIGAMPDSYTPPVTSVAGKTGAVVLTANDVGAMSKWDLLWTNASPTASFGEQTISLDLSGYDGVVVQTRRTNGSDQRTCHIALKGATTIMLLTLATPFNRECTPTDNGVTFGNCVYFTNFGGSSTATQNLAMIPVAIYGIKGVNS